MYCMTISLWLTSDYWLFIWKIFKVKPRTLPYTTTEGCRKINNVCARQSKISFGFQQGSLGHQACCVCAPRVKNSEISLARFHYTCIFELSLISAHLKKNCPLGVFSRSGRLYFWWLILGKKWASFPVQWVFFSQKMKLAEISAKWVSRYCNFCKSPFGRWFGTGHFMNMLLVYRILRGFVYSNHVAVAKACVKYSSPFERELRSVENCGNSLRRTQTMSNFLVGGCAHLISFVTMRTKNVTWKMMYVGFGPPWRLWRVWGLTSRKWQATWSTQFAILGSMA